MQVINRESTLWQYLSSEIRELIEDGEVVLSFVQKYREKEEISDYSFMVFPFSKAYEGFLKRFLLDVKLIKEEDYYSDDIRIGRILNPNYVKEQSNVFNRLCDSSQSSREIPKRLWSTWKKGRNLVFHYFPHNYRKLNYAEAQEIVLDIVSSMESAVMHCRV
jgi:hypothetical protein